MGRKDATRRLTEKDWRYIATNLIWSEGGFIIPPPDGLEEILTEDIQFLKPHEVAPELPPAEQESYGQAFAEFQDTVRDRLTADAGDSELTPYSQGDPIWPFVAQKRKDQGELKGIRQLVSDAIPADEDRPFPFETGRSGSQRFVVEVLRGIEEQSPVTFITIVSFTNQDKKLDNVAQLARDLNPGAESKKSVRALIVNFQNGNLQCGIRLAGSGNDIHITRGDERMKEVLSFWTDQLQLATIPPHPRARTSDPRQGPSFIRNPFRRK